MNAGRKVGKHVRRKRETKDAGLRETTKMTGVNPAGVTGCYRTAREKEAAQ